MKFRTEIKGKLTSRLCKYAKFLSFKLNILTCPGNEVASMVKFNMETSRILVRCVKSIKALSAMPVSCVDAQPPSVKRCAFSHLTIASTVNSCLDAYVNKAYAVVSMFNESYLYGRRGNEKYF